MCYFLNKWGIGRKEGTKDCYWKRRGCTFLCFRYEIRNGQRQCVSISEILFFLVFSPLFFLSTFESLIPPLFR